MVARRSALSWGHLWFFVHTSLPSLTARARARAVKVLGGKTRETRGEERYQHARSKGLETVASPTGSGGGGGGEK